LSREEIAGLHDIGKNAMKVIEATLKEFGLTLSARR
jgi:hypothetical protein